MEKQQVLVVGRISPDPKREFEKVPAEDCMVCRKKLQSHEKADGFCLRCYDMINTDYSA